MNERALLLRAIIDQPREDTPRLVYADLLQENGQSPLARMIREHINAYETLFDESIICGLNNFRMHGVSDSDPLHAQMVRVAGVIANYPSNGLNPFLWQLAQEERLAWCRGFVHYVRVSLDEMMDHAADLFLHQPITQVDLLGREPGEDGSKFYWVRANDTEELYDAASRLPGELFDLLVAEELDAVHSDVKIYSTYLAAMDALSVVCVSIGRAEARNGLPF